MPLSCVLRNDFKTLSDEIFLRRVCVYVENQPQNVIQQQHKILSP